MERDLPYLLAIFFLVNREKPVLIFVNGENAS